MKKYTYLSSRLVKEVARLGGDVNGLVPSLAGKYLKIYRRNQRRKQG